MQQDSEETRVRDTQLRVLGDPVSMRGWHCMVCWCACCIGRLSDYRQLRGGAATHSAAGTCCAPVRHPQTAHPAS
jgi:hypothetical protein